MVFSDHILTIQHQENNKSLLGKSSICDAYIPLDLSSHTVFSFSTVLSSWIWRQLGPRSQELNARINTAPNSETQLQQRLNGFCFHWPTHIQLTLNSHSCFKDWTIATHYISVIFEEYLSCFRLSTPCAKCAMYFTLLTQFIVLTVRVAHGFEYEKSYTV